MQSNEELILNFRKAFIALPKEVRTREVTRLYNIIKQIPVIVLEDEDIGKVLKFLTVADLREYFWTEKRIKVSDSYLYKVLKGQHPLMHGYKIYYEQEK